MRRRMPRSSAGIGLVTLAIIAILVFLGFTKDIPFTKPFQVDAVFQSANSIRKNSPVRIAGVEVGKVKEIKPQDGTDAAVVVMQIHEDGLPLHADATAKIRPRIFLEGNFFVDLRPGSPGEPELESGDTIKVTQTATPVQLDEVLTALQSDTRQDLQELLHGLAIALRSEPTAAQDRGSDPSARGETAAESFNDAYDDIPAAERSTAQVFEAFLGADPGRDVARLIEGTGRTTAALVRNEGALQDLITNFNVTMGAFASESANLQSTIRLLAPTLESANSAFDALNAAFPSTRAFAREVLPGVRETDETIDAAFPWIEQAHALVGPRELGGLARELSPASADLARLTDRAIALLPETRKTSRCVRDKILPAGDAVIHDEFDTGEENYKEFFYTLVGLSGEGQNFDGNGMYVRFQPGGGDQQVSLGSRASSSGELFGNNVAVPLGNRPFYPGERPPYRPDVPCTSNALPDVNGPAAAKSAPGPGPAP